MQAIRRSANLWRSSLSGLPTAVAVSTCHSSPHRKIHTQPCQQHLSRHSRGVKVWEEVSLARTNNGTAKSFDFEAVCNGMIANLQVNSYAKSSNMTKIFDQVTTPEQMNLAEKTLISFRRSLSRPTPALPLVVMRACLRVGRAKKALHLIRNKVLYGVFPSRRVYHILIDAFIREGDGAGAVAAYDQMLMDEVTPDRMTFHLAAVAHIMLHSPEGITAAASLCSQCYQLYPGHVSKTFIVLVRNLLHQEREEDVRSLITQSEGDQEVGVAQEVWFQLQTGIQDSGDHELIRKFEDLTKDMTSFRKPSPD